VIRFAGRVGSKIEECSKQMMEILSGPAFGIRRAEFIADVHWSRELTQDVCRLNKPAAVLPRIAVFSAVEHGAWRIMSKDSMIFAALLHSNG
jgi:hypothetical protein